VRARTSGSARLRLDAEPCCRLVILCAQVSLPRQLCPKITMALRWSGCPISVNDGRILTPWRRRRIPAIIATLAYLAKGRIDFRRCYVPVGFVTAHARMSGRPDR
jgi:hypothetical protein